VPPLSGAWSAAARSGLLALILWSTRVACRSTLTPFTAPLVSSGSVFSGPFFFFFCLSDIHFPAGFGASSTYADLANGDCTSCAVAQDKSAYWAPAIYFKHEDGSYEEVEQVGGMLA
jgi:hypothetical protein